MRRRVAPWLLGLVVAASATGCPSGGGTGTAPPPEVTQGPHDVWLAVRAGQDIDGKPAATHMVDGEPTLFVVFASWCQHCRNELAVLAPLRQYEPRLHIVGLNAYEDYAEISDDTKLRAFLGEYAPWLPVVRADAAMLKALGGVPKIPSVFLYDGRGQLVEAYRRHERRPPTADEILIAAGKLLPAP